HPHFSKSARRTRSDLEGYVGPSFLGINLDLSLDRPPCIALLCERELDSSLAPVVDGFIEALESLQREAFSEALPSFGSKPSDPADVNTSNVYGLAFRQAYGDRDRAALFLAE